MRVSKVSDDHKLQLQSEQCNPCNHQCFLFKTKAQVEADNNKWCGEIFYATQERTKIASLTNFQKGNFDPKNKSGIVTFLQCYEKNEKAELEFRACDAADKASIS